MTFVLGRRRAGARRGRTVLAAFAAAMAIVTLLPNIANADLFDRSIYNEHTGYCLTYESGGLAFADSCDGAWGDAQDWHLHQWRDGTWQVRSDWGGNRCLDDSYAYGLRVFNPCWSGSSVYSRYQSWYRYPTPGGWTFRNQATGRCLDHSFSHLLRTFPCNGLNYQGWTIF